MPADRDAISPPSFAELLDTLLFIERTAIARMPACERCGRKPDSLDFLIEGGFVCVPCARAVRDEPAPADLAPIRLTGKRLAASTTSP